MSDWYRWGGVGERIFSGRSSLIEGVKDICVNGHWGEKFENPNPQYTPFHNNPVANRYVGKSPPPPPRQKAPPPSRKTGPVRSLAIVASCFFAFSPPVSSCAWVLAHAFPLTLLVMDDPGITRIIAGHSLLPQPERLRGGEQGRSPGVRAPFLPYVHRYRCSSVVLPLSVQRDGRPPAWIVP